MEAELEKEIGSADVLTGNAPGRSFPLDSTVLEEAFLSPREQHALVYLENHYRVLYKHMSTEGSQRETQQPAELFPGYSSCTV